MNQNTESGGGVLVDTCIAELHRQLTEQNSYLRCQLDLHKAELNKMKGELETLKSERDMYKRIANGPA